jgi:hypothetical protein
MDDEMHQVLRLLAGSSGCTIAPFLIGTHGCSRRAIKKCLEHKFIQISTENVWGTDVERVCITAMMSWRMAMLP